MEPNCPVTMKYHGRALVALATTLLCSCAPQKYKHDPLRFLSGEQKVAELGSRLEVRCPVNYGPSDSPTTVIWYHYTSNGFEFLTSSNVLYHQRDETLTIQRLTEETLGVYSCESFQLPLFKWHVTVKAYQPNDTVSSPYLAPRDPVLAVTESDGTTTTTPQPEPTKQPNSQYNACGLKIETGSCRNYTINWYFDPTSGGCNQFWYGGCEGNGNRFATLEECEDICINPATKGTRTKDQLTESPSTTTEETELPSTSETELTSTSETEPPSTSETELPPTTSVYECDVSEFGCCFDNITTATGPDEEGCPCAITEFGCCPDDVSTATGPDFEGCSNGYDSTHEPNQEGYCLHSAYGCCPDGLTEATGHNFDGCPDKSEVRQDACGLKIETGSCRNYTINWYFDPTSGGCNQFWYGGCEGNGNRFATLEECEDICINPATKDQLTESPSTTTEETELPSTSETELTSTSETEPPSTSETELPPTTSVYECDVSEFGCCFDNITTATGPDEEGCPCAITEFGCCPDDVSTATGPDFEGCSNGYDSTHEPNQEGYCLHSAYGCCPDGLTEATGRNFDGCPDKSEDRQAACDLKMEPGSCDNYTMHWYFNPTSGGCDGFWYGGCEGNDNRFATLEECEDICINPATKEQSKEPPSTTTEETELLSTSETELLSTSETELPSTSETELPPTTSVYECDVSEFGCCFDNVTKATGPDKEGCSCAITEFGCCPDDVSTATGPDFEGCSNGCDLAHGPNQEGCCLHSAYGCCPDGLTEATGRNFDGCPDNSEDRQAICDLKMEPGSCDNYTMHWYFNPTSGGCDGFWYGGCEGNGNRFTTLEECEDICIKPSTEEQLTEPPSTTTEETELSSTSETELSSTSETELSSTSETELSGTSETELSSTSETELSSTSETELSSTSETELPPTTSVYECDVSEFGCCFDNVTKATGPNEKGCPCAITEFGCCPDDVSAATGPDFEGCSNGCDSTHEPNQEGCCLHSAYGCCPDGLTEATGHNFDGCPDKPEDRQDVCGLKIEPGSCQNYTINWYFDPTSGGCDQFWYGGCEGNGNRFATLEECEDICINPATKVVDKCSLSYDTGTCVNYKLHWYFSTEDQRCRQFYFGGCGGNDNNFQTEQQCQHECQPDPTTTTTSQPEQERQEVLTLSTCTDNPNYENCHLIVESSFCTHSYYKTFCCKSCVEAGQLDPNAMAMLTA